MKIAVDIQPLLSGCKSGIGYFGHSMVKELAKKAGNELTLQFFSLRHTREKLERLSKIYETENSRLECCRFFIMKFYLMLTAVLPVPRRLFFRKRADVSFFFNYVLPPFASGKKVVVVHDMVIKDHPETVSKKNKLILKTHLRRSIKRADLVVTISGFSKERILRYYPEADGKLAVVPCAVDHERFRPADEHDIAAAKEKYRIDGDYFLYLGNLEPRKNIERLIEAYSFFAAEHDDAPQLIIAGGKGWQFESVFDKVQRLKLTEKVMFTGYLDEEDVPAVMSGALAFCFATLYEGFGMPVLEAMACGTPVLTSNISSLPEVGGDCCVYADPYSTESMREGLEKLWNDKELRTRLSEAGIRRAERFTWKASSDMLYKEFEKLIREDGK